MCKTASQWAGPRQHRALSCADPEGWDGGREKLERKGIHVYIGLIHFVVWQKLTNIVKQLSSN